MNITRLLLAIVAGAIFIFASDAIVHSIWLLPDYTATKEIWRSDAEMTARLPWMLGAQLVCALAFTMVWALGFAGRSLGTGVLFGFWMGVFQGVWALMNFVVLPMPGALASKWFVAGILQSILLGLIVAAIYRSASAPRPTPAA